MSWYKQFEFYSFLKEAQRADYIECKEYQNRLKEIGWTQEERQPVLDKQGKIKGYKKPLTPEQIDDALKDGKMKIPDIDEPDDLFELLERERNAQLLAGIDPNAPQEADPNAPQEADPIEEEEDEEVRAFNNARRQVEADGSHLTFYSPIAKSGYYGTYKDKQNVVRRGIVSFSQNKNWYEKGNWVQQRGDLLKVSKDLYFVFQNPWIVPAGYNKYTLKIEKPPDFLYAEVHINKLNQYRDADVDFQIWHNGEWMTPAHIDYDMIIFEGGEDREDLWKECDHSTFVKVKASNPAINLEEYARMGLEVNP